MNAILLITLLTISIVNFAAYKATEKKGWATAGLHLFVGMLFGIIFILTLYCVQYQ